MAFVKDRAHTIREFGVKKLPVNKYVSIIIAYSSSIQNLIQVYKVEWVFGNLLPKLQEALKQENGYLFRITALYCLQVNICSQLLIIYNLYSLFEN